MTSFPASPLPDQIHNSVFRDNIAGNRLIEADQHIRRIVDTEEFQRLRHIRQMGLASYVFPTAEHSRFAHSLGVYATARAAYQQLRTRSADLDLPLLVRFDDEVEAEFCIACLCHDLGHTPFSHVLENTLLPEGYRSHEECTLALLSTERARAYPYSSGAIVGYLWSDKELGHDASDSG